MHDVVVMAVRKAVRAATMTFTAISMMRLFMRHLLSRLILVEAVATIATAAVTVAGSVARTLA